MNVKCFETSGALTLAFLSVLVVEILRFLCLIDLGIFPYYRLMRVSRTSR